MGFEIEDVEQKALEEMGVFGWPGLEKRAEDFSQSAADDELLMVYVKDGSATLTDSEESLPVKAGQMVMVSAGDVRWSGIASGGVTLLSTSTSLVDVDEFSVDQGSMVDASKVVDAIKAEDEEVKDLDLKEAGLCSPLPLLRVPYSRFSTRSWRPERTSISCNKCAPCSPGLYSIATISFSTSHFQHTALSQPLSRTSHTSTL